MANVIFGGSLSPKKYSSTELRELSLLEGKSEDAKGCCDYGRARMYYDEMIKIHDGVNKRQKEDAKARFRNAVREIRKRSHQSEEMEM